MAGCGGKKRTESKVRQIVSGLMIFAGVLHFIYLIVAMAGTWDARFQPVRFYLNASSLNASSAYAWARNDYEKRLRVQAESYKPNPAALSTGLLLGITGSVLIYFGLCMMFEIGDACDRKQLLVRWFYPGLTCFFNLAALMLMIMTISSGRLQTPIGVGVGWVIVDFVLFVSTGYVCWLERRTCPCLKDGDVTGADTKRVELP